MGKFIDQINKLSDTKIEIMLYSLVDSQINEVITTLKHMPGHQQVSQIGELKKIVRKRKLQLPEEHKSFFKRF